MGAKTSGLKSYLYSMEENEMEPEVCPVPRWQLIKATLNNLKYEDFVGAVQSDSNAQLIDVRTEAEHLQESIPDSMLLDYLDRDLASKLEALDPSKNFYIYCRTGRRSSRICVILRNMGFRNVYNLEGGIASKP